MTHREKLLEIYNLCSIPSNFNFINKTVEEEIVIIASNATKQKGVYSVLVTLLVHKILNPKQDVRKHQASMNGGFSGRSIDTKYITPTLKELNLPSMAESGWLTRSLEQPYPYTLDYNGKISNIKVKFAFLNLLDFVENNPNQAYNVLCSLLNKVRAKVESSHIKIIPLTNPDTLTINDIIFILESHFMFNYSTHGGSKLPVLAFYAIYQSLIKELKRYDGKSLAPLGSHTASDRTSKAAGDIEIVDNKQQLFEAIEIKLDKPIDPNMVRIAIEKIYRFNPSRYYILSSVGFKKNKEPEMSSLVAKTKDEHGCQIILNGLMPTLKYYLRLISKLEDFIFNYSLLIESDREIQECHKIKWNELIENYLNN